MINKCKTKFVKGLKCNLGFSCPITTLQYAKVTITTIILSSYCNTCWSWENSNSFLRFDDLIVLRNTHRWNTWNIQGIQKLVLYFSWNDTAFSEGNYSSTVVKIKLIFLLIFCLLSYYTDNSSQVSLQFDSPVLKFGKFDVLKYFDDTFCQRHKVTWLHLFHVNSFTSL